MKEFLEARFNQNIWTKRNGKTVQLKHINNEHIENIIGMIERGGNAYGYGKQWLPKLKWELLNRQSSTLKYYKFLRSSNVSTS